MTVMKIWASALLAVGVSAGVHAEDAKPKKQFSEKQLAQHQRMRDCSAEAKSKAMKGDERKAFMKTCLSGGEVETHAGDVSASAETQTRTAQKDKRKACTAEAKTQDLKGDARKAFMDDCVAK